MLHNKNKLFWVIYISIILAVLLYLLLQSSLIYTILSTLPLAGGNISKAHYEFVLHKTSEALKGEEFNVFSVIDLSDYGFQGYIEHMGEVSKIICLTNWDYFSYWWRFVDHCWFGGLSYKNFFLYFGPFIFTSCLYFLSSLFFLLKLGFWIEEWYVINQKKIDSLNAKYRIYLFLQILFILPLCFFAYLCFGFFGAFLFFLFFIFLMYINGDL